MVNDPVIIIPPSMTIPPATLTGLPPYSVPSIYTSFCTYRSPEAERLLAVMSEEAVMLATFILLTPMLVTDRVLLLSL